MAEPHSLTQLATSQIAALKELVHSTVVDMLMCTLARGSAQAGAGDTRMKHLSLEWIVPLLPQRLHSHPSLTILDCRFQAVTNTRVYLPVLSADWALI